METLAAGTYFGLPTQHVRAAFYLSRNPCIQILPSPSLQPALGLLTAEVGGAVLSACPFGVNLDGKRIYLLRGSCAEQSRAEQTSPGRHLEAQVWVFNLSQQ